MPATTVLFFENSLGRITLEAEGYLRLQWQVGHQASEAVRAVLAQLLRAQLQTSASCLLIDARLALPFSETDQAWLMEEWLPQAVTQARPPSVAHLLANDVFARLSRVAVVAKARRLGFRHQTFQQEADALRWLRQQSREKS